MSDEPRTVEERVEARRQEFERLYRWLFGRAAAAQKRLSR